MSSQKFGVYVRNTLIAGILTTLPIIVTYFFLSFLLDNMTGFLLPYITILTERMGLNLPPFYVKVLSFTLFLTFILSAGMVAKNYVGKKFIGKFEQLMDKIPLVRISYSATKQLIDTFKNSSSSSFSKVVIVEYPRKGAYSLGFVTCESVEMFDEKLGVPTYNVFVPTTPNPTSGFIVIFPKSEVTVLDVSVQDGIKFIISAGVLSPEKGMHMVKDETNNEEKKL